MSGYDNSYWFALIKKLCTTAVRIKNVVYTSYFNFQFSMIMVISFWKMPEEKYDVFKDELRIMSKIYVFNCKSTFRKYSKSNIITISYIILIAVYVM